MWKEIGEKVELRLQLRGMTQILKSKMMEMMVLPWGLPLATGESLSQLERPGTLCHKQEKVKQYKKWIQMFCG